MVKIYFANISLLKRQGLFEEFFEKVHPQRQEKIRRCKQEEDKYRSLLAGLLLKYGLEQEGICYKDIVIAKNSYGKPSLENKTDISFNLSHSGAYVVCAVSDKNIGVDIERPVCFRQSDKMKNERRQALLEKTAKRCFSEAEYRYYEDCKQTFGLEKQMEVFLKFWTRKESYSKAVGAGLGMDFSKIDVLSEAAEQSFWSDWLKEGYYLSISQEAICLEQVLLIEAAEENFLEIDSSSLERGKICMMN